ncbi:MAG: YqgE/AlgH family protein [Desulfuromonadales bacterium]|nr:YqgE/AlgH family protein [Desulfuromonadales bacterium]
MNRWLIHAGLMILLFMLLLADPLLAGHTGFSPQRGRLLVAGESMRDPRFAESVVLLLKHDQSGTVGLIMNNRSDLIPHGLPDEVAAGIHYLYFGGPVEPFNVSVLVFAQEPPEEAREILTGVYLTSPAGLERLLAQGKTVRFRVFLGYAGWAPGQLEMELAHGAWQVHPAEGELLSRDNVEQLWQHFQQSGPVISL